MFTSRSSGVLLHPTCFPGPYGVGDLGDEARRFVDWLAAAGQRWWQILPLNPTWRDGSPYKSPGAFAGNPLLVSPDRLFRDGLLDESDLARARTAEAGEDGRIDFPSVARRKAVVHQAAFDRFRSFEDGHPLASPFHEFRNRSAGWLAPYARFLAAGEAQAGKPWMNWDAEFRAGRGESPVFENLARRIEYYEFEQFLLHRQWAELRSYAAERGVRIIGDLPIYVAQESADVWAEPEIFHLDETGRPREVAGVPPDYFSPNGQLWNNPIYNWELLANRGFDWWIRRIHAALDLVDVARLDHFRGFAAYWSVPAGHSTAVHGKWNPGPGPHLFEAVRRSLAGRFPGRSLPLIAEDLGTITPDVVALRKQFDLPGMRVLQFEILDGGDRAMQVDRYEADAVVYTGTHDNDTTVGWFHSEILPNPARLGRLREFTPAQPDSIAWELIEMAWRSSAVLAVAPLQDVLSLGGEARMNTPGTTAEEAPNWQWRYSSDALSSQLADRLAALTDKHHRG